MILIAFISIAFPENIVYTFNLSLVSFIIKGYDIYRYNEYAFYGQLVMKMNSKQIVSFELSNHK
jgi:hypothetical protein